MTPKEEAKKIFNECGKELLIRWRDFTPKQNSSDKNYTESILNKIYNQAKDDSKEKVNHIISVEKKFKGWIDKSFWEDVLTEIDKIEFSYENDESNKSYC